MTYQINPSHSGSPGAQTLVTPLKPAWTIDLGGPVSYPLLGGYVFVTATSLTTNHPQLYAINYHSGAIAWGPIDLGGSYWANASYDNERVFTINSSGQMQAFDEQTGAVQWTTQLPGQSSFTSPPSGSIFGSNSDLVYTSGAGSGGTLYAVHEGTGAIAWTASVMNGDHSTPVVTNSGVYVSYACAQTYDFEPLTGALLWHHATGCEGGGGKTAVLYNGKLYVRDAAIGNTVLDASTGASLGTFSATVAPAFSGSTGYFLSGSTLQAVDLATNATVWTFTGDGSLSTAPIVVNGNVYIGSASGTIYGVDTSTGAQSWSANAGAPINAPDEQNASKPLAGLSAGGGYLAVPAGNTLTLFGSVLQVAPGSLNFGIKSLGSTTSSQVGITNNFAGGMTVTSITASGDYSTTTNCGTLNPGQQCQISVSFTPSAYGQRNGTLTINDTAPGSPHIVTLLGGATDGVVDHLVITPPAATVVAGVSQAYGVEAYDVYGQDFGDYTGLSRVTFSINGGTCTGNVCTTTKAGSEQVTALFTGQARSVGGVTTLNVTGGPLDHITIAPGSTNVVAGASQAYTTEGFDQYGNDLGSTTTASTFSITPDGSCTGSACTATAPGAHTVTAADNSTTATAQMTVAAGPLDHITISPSTSTMPAGGSQAYTTEAFDQYGNDLGSATAASTFSTGPNGSCAAATCTATAAGSHTVTATDSGKTALATLTVSAGSLDHITISSPDNNWAAGAVQPYATEAFDQYGNDLGSATAASTFSISPTGSCTGATCTATVAGSYTVTATDNGKAAAWSLMIHSAGLDHLVISPSTVTVKAGDQMYFSVGGADQYGNSFPYSIGAAMTIGPDGSCYAGTCTATIPGTHTITAMASGLTATATMIVTVGPAATLTLSPASSTITAGGTATYTVSAADQYGNGLGDVTAATRFSIAPDGTCSGATCGTTKAGTHAVTATEYGGPAGTAALTVTASAFDHIGLTPATSTITAGSSQPYTTEGYDQYGNDLGPAPSATLSITPDGTCSAGSCSATHSSVHTVTATASGKTATATLAVSPGPMASITIYAAGTTPAGYAQPYSLIAWDQYGNGIRNVLTGFTLTIGSPATPCPGTTCTETQVGVYLVTATYQGLTATAKQTVVPGPLDHLVLSPATATIVAGGSQAYTVGGVDIYGNDMGSLASSTSIFLSGAGYCPGMTCTGLTSGTQTVTATNQAKTATATLVVNAGPAVNLRVLPGTLDLVVGASARLTAVPYDAYGNPADATAATWSLSRGTPGTLGSTTGSATTFTAKFAGTGAVILHLGALTAQSPVRVFPAAPTALTATSPASHKVSLAWTRSAGDLTYAVYRQNGTGWTLIKKGLTSTSFTDGGLTSGTNYTYYVTGWSGGFESAASNSVSITVK